MSTRTQPTFQTARRGLMGNKPLGADYMQAVAEAARKLQAATEIPTTGPMQDSRQLRLPMEAKGPTR